MTETASPVWARLAEAGMTGQKTVIPDHDPGSRHAHYWIPAKSMPE